MEQREFIRTISACRRKLNLAGFLDKAVFALCIGAGAGVLFQAAALALPLYYANLYTVLALLPAILAAAAAAYVKRSGMGQAALKMDSFGFGERIVTAYEHLDEDGELVRLQRGDAMRQLAAHKGRIRIRIMPSWKKSALFIALSAICIGLALVPTVPKERAKELHNVKETAREKEEEIKEAVNGLKQLKQEELAPGQQASIQEMVESLESSISEYQQASSAEELNAADGKLNYKYNDISSQLSEFAESLQNGAEVSSVTAESIQAMAKKMNQLSGMQSPDGGNLASNQGQGGQNSGNGQNGENSQGSGNGQNGENGQDGGNGQNGENGQGNGDGQNGGSGQGSGDGQNGEGGQGNGDGQNGGNGQNGENGQGGGSGRGTGSSDTPHDYVSVPNAIADSGNLTGSAVDHDASEYFLAPNGLSWEGTHVSHEAVIGSYEQNAYEGIAAGRYPSGMEDVIKEYFSSFN